MKQRTNKQTGELSVDELHDAKMLWIKYVQKIHFQDEISAIQNRTRNTRVIRLGLQIDHTGVLICTGGRLEYSDLPRSSVHPILLPKNSHYTTLTIQHVHKVLFHSGVNHTLASLRNQFWVPQGRSIVRRVVMSCKICKRVIGGPFAYPCMPELPTERVRRTKIFENISLDFLGPLHVKKENRSDANQTYKVYVCLLNCMVTRAVHLEIVRDMTAEQFLLAIRRHFALRGVAKHIYSDQAAQHLLMDKLFQDVFHEMTQNRDVQTYMAQHGIKWHFTPAYSPWSRGYVEILVKACKQALIRTIGKVTLTFDQLSTILYEVSSILNSRPLTYIGDDIKSLEVLTPQSFMCLEITGTPDIPTDLNDPDYTPMTSNRQLLLESWKKGQKIIDHYWVIWREQ